MTRSLDRKFSVAPMMDWTDTHCRYLMRLITNHAILYTEMITTGAILYGNNTIHLAYNPEEHPVALQLGGSKPAELAKCAKIGEQWGYDEINLNCGCPSDRVQSGRFGASLMAEPDLVADCLKAMSDACDRPITIKCRIGIDQQDSYQSFRDFVGSVTANTGCSVVIVHARKAWLKGLSPKENREIPPLQYDFVYQLKREFPQLEIILNGGINSPEEGLAHLDYVDGIMMGRQAYQNPFSLRSVDQLFYGLAADQQLTQQAVAEQFLLYAQKQMDNNVRLHHLTRHILGLFHQTPGARKFRRHISENAHKPNAGVEVLQQALQYITQCS